MAYFDWYYGAKNTTKELATNSIYASGNVSSFINYLWCKIDRGIDVGSRGFGGLSLGYSLNKALKYYDAKDKLRMSVSMFGAACDGYQMISGNWTLIGYSWACKGFAFVTLKNATRTVIMYSLPIHLI